MRTFRRISAISLIAIASVAAACSPPIPAVVSSTVPSVDVNQYLGTWYEVASVKQFFSAGLVNTKAVYSANPDGSIRVENSGNYFFDGGPQSSIVGSAVPVDSTNSRLNVSFTGSNGAQPPGNYWIIDLADDYSWAAVSDPTGNSFFLLTREKTIDPTLKAEIIARAAALGVKTGGITDTQQF